MVSNTSHTLSLYVLWYYRDPSVFVQCYWKAADNKVMPSENKINVFVSVCFMHFIWMITATANKKKKKKNSIQQKVSWGLGRAEV